MVSNEEQRTEQDAPVRPSDAIKKGMNLENSNGVNMAMNRNKKKNIAISDLASDNIKRYAKRYDVNQEDLINAMLECTVLLERPTEEMQAIMQRMRDERAQIKKERLEERRESRMVLSSLSPRQLKRLKKLAEEEGDD